MQTEESTPGYPFELAAIELRRIDPADRRPNDALDLADHARARGCRRRPARIADHHLEAPSPHRTPPLPAGAHFANLRQLCLRRAAWRAFVAHHGKRQRQPPRHCEQRDCPVEERLCNEELRDDIAHALVRLSSRQATAVVMRHILELSYEEIGSALGCSETTARVHVNRACKRLSRLLAHLAPLHSTESRK